MSKHEQQVKQYCNKTWSSTETSSFRGHVEEVNGKSKRKPAEAKFEKKKVRNYEMIKAKLQIKRTIEALPTHIHTCKSKYNSY